MKLKRLVNIFALYALLMPFSSMVCDAQTRLDSVQLSTQMTIQELISKEKSLTSANKSNNFRNSLNQFSRSSNKLYEKIDADKIDYNSIDTVFIISLEETQYALENILINWGNNDEDASTKLKKIKMDFDIKTKNLAFAAESKLLTNVEINVITKSGDALISGYDVYYTYMWDVDRKKKRMFNNQTNDATKILSPGLYFFWIEKNKKIISEKEGVEIGNMRQPKETIIFNL